ncbi:MAG: hypothetical protein QOI21_2344 [Actinomycetota bacterium]|jgi:hypothetical protein|nr:hypothetical protein [Actinomycetota bacterium]
MNPFSVRLVNRRTVVIALGGAGILFSSVACGQTTAEPPATTSSSGTPQGPETNPAGDIPDSQAFVPFTATDGTYSVTVPEGWSRAVNGAATVFTDKFNSVRIEAKAKPTAPSVADAQATELPVVAQQAQGFAPGKVSSDNRKAGAVVLLTYQLDSPVDPVTGKSVPQQVERYEFWRPTTEIVITLSSPVGADNVDPWRRVTDSFQWRP